MISSNIKFIRKYFKHTQKTLAKDFLIPQSTISDYENAKKQIPIDYLKKISKKYGVSMYDLTSKDLSLEYALPQKIDLIDAQNLCEKMFPIFTLKEEELNDNFNYACEGIQSVFPSYSLDATLGKVSVLEHAITLFQKSWEESNTYVALANSISLIFVVYAIYSHRGIKLGEELVRKGNIGFDDISEYIIKNSNINTPYENHRKKIFKKYESLVYDNIKFLKSNVEYSALGDYYLALSYFLGFVEEEMDCELSGTIALYMMDKLCKLDNIYAKNFIMCFEQIL